MRVVTSHLPADLAKKLDGLAPEEKRRRLTLEALADVRSGRTHDHAAIEVWAAGLDAPRREIRR